MYKEHIYHAISVHVCELYQRNVLWIKCFDNLWLNKVFARMHQAKLLGTLKDLLYVNFVVRLICCRSVGVCGLFDFLQENVGNTITIKIEERI